LNSVVFDNPCLPFDANNRNYLKKNFFTNREFENFKQQIYALTISDLINPELIPNTKAVFEVNTGIELSNIKFLRLRNLAATAVNTYRKIDNNERRRDTVRNFCMRIKRGSKKYRKIISGKTPFTISTNITRYSDIIDQVINLDNSVRLNTQWSCNYLDNSTRTFLFKLHNNLLGTNTRVAHFVRNHPRTCTFCGIAQDPEDHPETILHLFFECVHIERLLSAFYLWLFGMENAPPISARNFLIGFEFENTHKKQILDLCGILVKKYIWDCKLRYHLPRIEDLKNSFLSEFKNIYNHNSKVRSQTQKSQLFANNNEIHF